MKIIIASILLFSALVADSALQAQNVKFNDYFSDSTLRINYLRVGNRQHDTVQLQSHECIGLWAGSLTQLLDPFDNGAYCILVKDPL